jgi:zinc protease
MRDPGIDLATACAGVAGGLLVEDEGDNGVGNFMARVLPKATRDLDSAALSLAAERLGMWISAQSGRNSLRLRGAFLNDNWREALPLFAEVLTRPAFDPVNVEEARREMLAEIAARDEDPDALAVENANRLLYPGHPYRLTPLGSAANVSRFTAEDLAAHYRRFMHPGSMVIAVAGNIDPGAVRDALAGVLKDWKTDSAVVAKPAPPPAGPASPALVVEERDFSQTRIVFGFQGTSFDSNDAAPLDVLLGYLSGSGGPLFRKLRDEQSLAYSVFGWAGSGVGAGDVKFYIGTDPAKAAVAFAGMRKIIEDAAANGIAEKDVDDARRYLLGRHKFSKQGIGDQAESLLSNLLNRAGKDFDGKYLAAIEAVTPDDVRRVAKRFLDFDKAVYSLVGPAASLDAVRGTLRKVRAADGAP